MQRVTIRLEDDLLQEIEDEAEQQGTSKSQVIRKRLKESQQLRDQIDSLEEERDELRRDLKDNMSDALEAIQTVAERTGQIEDTAEVIEQRTRPDEKPWYKRILPG
ncbi:MAG: ribbon-helix-helix protein, CopG family [bacterium]